MGALALLLTIGPLNACSRASDRLQGIRDRCDCHGQTLRSSATQAEAM
jgi:hypothetical protein